MELVLRWIAGGKLKVDALITHRFALPQIDEAIDACVESPHKTLGVILRMR